MTTDTSSSASETRMDIEVRLSLKHKRPTWAVWELTQSCTWNCSHCYLGKKTHRGKLTLAQCERVLDQLAEAGIPWLCLTGGEPTLHPQFWKMVPLAQREGFRIRLFSILSHLTEKQVDQLADFNFDIIDVSILGSTPEIHDGISRVRGSFKKAIHRIERLLQRGVKVGIKNVVMAANVADRGNVRALARRLGCAFREDWTLVHRTDSHEAPGCGGVCHSDYVEGLRQDNKEAGKALWVAPSEDETHRCGAGTTGWSLDPDATVFPCVVFRVPCGNLLKNTWQEIYNHPLMQQIQMLGEATPEACKGCETQSFCKRCWGQAFMESGDWRAPARTNCQSASARYAANRGEFQPSNLMRLKPEFIPSDVSDDRLRQLGFSEEAIRGRTSSRSVRAGCATERGSVFIPVNLIRLKPKSEPEGVRDERLHQPGVSE